MSDDSLSKTMIIPNPGGRRTPNQSPSQPPPEQPPGNFSPPPSSPPPMQSATMSQNGDFGRVEGENIILSACSDILTLAGNIKSLEPSNSIEQLRVDIDRLISHFSNELSNASVSNEIILTARYILCCLLDELVLSTPWGTESSWSQQTLLSKYHNETWGGEKFFLIVNKLLEQPQKNINLIELCYVCLSVGFSGKYRVSPQGQNELIQISQRLYQHIEQNRPIDRDLSPTWQGVGRRQQGLVKRFPSWVFFLILLFCVAGVYIGLLSNLKTKVDPIYAQLEAVGWQDFVFKVNAKQSSQVDVNSIANSLRNDLRLEISANLLAVDAKDNMVIIRFISPILFGSGSSVVEPAALPEVNKLVNAIAQYASQVWVVGHTDSTGKADSNWVISRKRAEAIAQWLKQASIQLPNTITRAAADTQPLVPNTSEHNRSLNRRVELKLVLKG